MFFIGHIHLFRNPNLTPSVFATNRFAHLPPSVHLPTPFTSSNHTSPSRTLSAAENHFSTMYCLRWWIPLFLLPFPKTSPFFLILFLFSFSLHSQPCMYCALILTGLFSTSSNWYALDVSAPSLHATNSSSPATSNNSSAPRPSYGWIDLGLSGGNGFFSPLARPDSAVLTTNSTTPEYYSLSTPWSEKRVDVPKRFYLGVGKHQGLGVWIDLGSSLGDSTSSPEVSNISIEQTTEPTSQEAAAGHVEL